MATAKRVPVEEFRVELTLSSKEALILLQLFESIGTSDCKEDVQSLSMSMYNVLYGTIGERFIGSRFQTFKIQER